MTEGLGEEIVSFDGVVEEMGVEGDHAKILLKGDCGSWSKEFEGHGFEVKGCGVKSEVHNNGIYEVFTTKLDAVKGGELWG